MFILKAVIFIGVCKTVFLFPNRTVANNSEESSSGCNEDWIQYDAVKITTLVVSNVLVFILCSLSAGLIYCKRKWLREKWLKIKSDLCRSSTGEKDKRSRQSQEITKEQDGTSAPIYSNVEHIEQISFTFSNARF